MIAINISLFKQPRETPFGVIINIFNVLIAFDFIHAEENSFSCTLKHFGGVAGTSHGADFHIFDNLPMLSGKPLNGLETDLILKACVTMYDRLVVLHFIVYMIWHHKGNTFSGKLSFC